jgi:cell filamentation protein
VVKYADNSKDPYIDSKTGILRNLLGISDQPTLDKVETGFTFLRAEELEIKPLQGNLDLKYVQAIHKHLFGDVYEWAGQLRQIDLSKGATRFAHASAIESAGTKLFSQLHKEKYLRGLNAEAFSQRAGYYLGEVNVLHPFREGNGRTQRAFISFIALNAGYEIAWTRITQTEMIRASIEAYHADSSYMAQLIQENLIEIGENT